MNRPFSPIHILKALVNVFPFLGITFAVVFGTIIFGILFSILLAKWKLSKNKFAHCFASAYINALRCTPAIVLLFIVFYGLPKFVLVVFNVNINFWPKIIFVVISLSLLYSASLAEIFRSAYESIGKGQYEAAISIGLSPMQAMCRIVIPQAFVTALPNLGNSLISLLKEGSLAYTIGLVDIMGAGNLYISRNFGGYAIETYIALAIIYWTLTVLIEKGFGGLKKNLSKGKSNAVKY